MWLVNKMPGDTGRRAWFLVFYHDVRHLFDELS